MNDQTPINTETSEPTQQVYDFAELSESIAAAMLAAAEAQVTEAHNLMERTKVLAEGIRAQAVENTAMLNAMNMKLKKFGATVLQAHREFSDS